METVSTVSKRREVLYTDEKLRAKLNENAKVVFETILQFESKYKQNLDKEITSEAIANLLDNGFKNEQLQSIKYKEDVNKMLSEYPNLQKEKALEMFINESDKVLIDGLIALRNDIINKIKNINSHGVGSVSLENYIVNDEFVMNNKVQSRIKTACTTYCQNEKQVLLKEFAERISEIVRLGLKTELISTKHYELNGGMLIDINNGEVKYHQIEKY